MGVFFLVIACGEETSIQVSDGTGVVEASESSSQEIVGGRQDRRFRGVGYVANASVGWNSSSQLGLCGAVFVGTNVAVTAAHCVLDPNAQYVVGFGERDVYDHYYLEYRVRQVVRHPEYQYYRATEETQRRNIAALILERSPSAIPLTPAASVSAYATFIGYGRDYGVRNRATSPVDLRRSTTLFVHRQDGTGLFTQSRGAGLHWGDSGGALVDSSGLQFLGLLTGFQGQTVGARNGLHVFTSATAERPFIEAAVSCEAENSVSECIRWRLSGGTRRACTWRCDDYGYNTGDCYGGFYCDGDCIIYNGCRN